MSITISDINDAMLNRQADRIRELESKLSNRDADVVSLTNQRDYEYVRAENAEQERDQLKAENESLYKNLRGKHSITGATYAHIISERDQLREQVKLLLESMDAINSTGIDRAPKWTGMSARDIARLALAATEPKP